MRELLSDPDQELKQNLPAIEFSHQVSHSEEWNFLPLNEDAPDWVPLLSWRQSAAALALSAAADWFLLSGKHLQMAMRLLPDASPSVTLEFVLQ